MIRRLGQFSVAPQVALAPPRVPGVPVGPRAGLAPPAPPVAVPPEPTRAGLSTFVGIGVFVVGLVTYAVVQARRRKDAPEDEGADKDKDQEKKPAARRAKECTGGCPFVFSEAA